MSKWERTLNLLPPRLAHREERSPMPQKTRTSPPTSAATLDKDRQSLSERGPRAFFSSEVVSRRICFCSFESGPAGVPNTSNHNHARTLFFNVRHKILRRAGVRNQNMDSICRANKGRAHLAQLA